MGSSGNTLTVKVDGHSISGAGNPGGEMTSRGAVMYSSQWTGWVPGSCGGDGNLGASTFTVSNLKIQGTVIQGSEPRRCAPEPTPAPPSPAPPAPSHGCPGGSMSACLGL